MNSRGEGSRTKSVEVPQGFHTLKEEERGNRLTVALTVTATASRVHRDQLLGSKFG